MKYILPFLLFLNIALANCGNHPSEGFKPSPKEFSPVKILSADGDITIVESSGNATVIDGNYADAYQLAYYKAGNNALLGASKVDLEAFSHVDNNNFMSLLKEIQKGEIVDREVKSIDWDRLGNSVSVTTIFKVRSTSVSDPNRLQVLFFDLTKDEKPKIKEGNFYIGEGRSKSLLLLDEKNTDVLLKRIEASNPADFWSVKSVNLKDKTERKVFEVVCNYDDSGMKYRKSLFQMIERTYYYRMPKEYYLPPTGKTIVQIDPSEWMMILVDRRNVTTQIDGYDVWRYGSHLNFESSSEFKKVRPEIQVLPAKLTRNPINLNNKVFLNLQFISSEGKELGVKSFQLTGDRNLEYNDLNPFYQKKYKKWTMSHGTREYIEDGYYLKIVPDVSKEYTFNVVTDDISPKSRQSIHVVHAGFDNKEIYPNYNLRESLAKLKNHLSGKE